MTADVHEYYVLDAAPEKLPHDYAARGLQAEADQKCLTLAVSFNAAAERAQIQNEVSIVSAHAGDRPVLRVMSSDAAMARLAAAETSYVIVKINRLGV